MSEELKNQENDEIRDQNHESDDSHEYDGIKELNNPAPYWIMAIFFVTIGFSMLYAIENFGYPGNKMDQESRYQQSLADHEQAMRDKRAMETGEEYQMSQDEMVAAGKILYVEKGCTACHGSAGEGNVIGPNLTDNYWINGCSAEEVTEVIREGRPAKGMTPYKTMMTGEQMEHLTAYILHELVGSNPANAREPQGEECK